MKYGKSDSGCSKGNKVNYSGFGNQRDAQKSNMSGKSAYDHTMKVMMQAGNAAAAKSKSK